jgi:hypothetical protein
MENAQETAARALARLSEPFASKEVKWLVAATSRDGRKGRVTPYADPRAYTDRLNEVVTPSGWTREYKVHTLSPITRIKKDKPIQTGKVLVTCMVTIPGVGMHSGSGEAWADDENAMTSAEAQAFKRACSCFGLGRYFYNFDEMWVELNEYKQPKEVPQLPAWALPADERIDKDQPKETTRTRAKATKPRGPIDAGITDKITGFQRELGRALCEDVLFLVSGVRNPREIPNQAQQQAVFSSLEKCQRGMQSIREMASVLPETQFYVILDELKIASLDRIPSFEAFRQLGKAMSKATHRDKAA